MHAHTTLKRGTVIRGLLCLLASLATSSSLIAEEPVAERVMLASMERALQEPGACFFLPPKGWEMVDSKYLLPEVKCMVKTQPKSQNHLPPSINLALEPTNLSLEEYLLAVARMNKEDGIESWARLGTLATGAGEMVLTQLDITTEWGAIRMLQGIMVKRKTAYVLTATAQLSEFAQFSPDFLSALESFTINKDLFQMVADKEKRVHLREMVHRAKGEWHRIFQQNLAAKPELKHDLIAKLTFDCPSFQDEVWEPLTQNLLSSYKMMGSLWQDKFLTSLKDDLFVLE